MQLEMMGLVSQALRVVECKARLGSDVLSRAPFCRTIWQQPLSSCLWGLAWRRSVDMECFAGDPGGPAGFLVCQGGRRSIGGYVHMLVDRTACVGADGVLWPSEGCTNVCAAHSCE